MYIDVFKRIRIWKRNDRTEKNKNVFCRLHLRDRQVWFGLKRRKRGTVWADGTPIDFIGTLFPLRKGEHAYLQFVAGKHNERDRLYWLFTDVLKRKRRALCKKKCEREDFQNP